MSFGIFFWNAESQLPPCRILEGVTVKRKQRRFPVRFWSVLLGGVRSSTSSLAKLNAQCVLVHVLQSSGMHGKQDDTVQAMRDAGGRIGWLEHRWNIGTCCQSIRFWSTCETQNCQWCSLAASFRLVQLLTVARKRLHYLTQIHSILRWCGLERSSL